MTLAKELLSQVSVNEDDKRKEFQARKKSNIESVRKVIMAQKEKISKMKDDHEKAMEREHEKLTSLRKDLEFRKNQY